MSSYKTSNVDELDRLSPRYILFPSGSTATAQDIIYKLTARYEFAGTKWIATKDGKDIIISTSQTRSALKNGCELTRSDVWKKVEEPYEYAV